MNPLLSSSLVLLSLLTLGSAAEAQGGVTRYCQSGLFGSQISATGSTDFAANGGAGDLTLSATPAPAGGIGTFFYGDVATPATPFGDGFLCVAGSPQVHRLGFVIVDENGVASGMIDYGMPPSPLGQISPGSTWNFQYWFRNGASFDLSDALQIDFVPPQAMVTTTLLTGTKSVHPLAQSFGGVLVIQDQAEYDAFWMLHDGHTPPQTPPSVDFDLNAVVAVYAGRRFTSGYFIEVTDADLSVTSLDVTSLETQPGLGCGVIFTETQPFQLVTVRRVPGLELNTWAANTTSHTCP